MLYLLYFHSHSLPVFPLAHSQTLQDLHPVYEYVCQPMGKRFEVAKAFTAYFAEEMNEK